MCVCVCLCVDLVPQLLPSAVEVEQVLMAHPSIKDCAVLGMPDPIWGEIVTAMIVLEQNASAKEVIIVS